MLSAIVLGIAQGAQHSFEPDHLAAVSVLLGEHRGAGRSAWLGAVWGMGHTLALLAMSVTLLVVDAALPASADLALTWLVGALLIALGVRSLWPHAHATHRDRPVRSPLQALAVGVVHGLAGSSALCAMVFASMPSTTSQVLYITCFGGGSIVGMAAVSYAAGAWLRRVHAPRLTAVLRGSVGLASVIVGVLTVVRAGVTAP